MLGQAFACLSLCLYFFVSPLTHVTVTIARNSAQILKFKSMLTQFQVISLAAQYICEDDFTSAFDLVEYVSENMDSFIAHVLYSAISDEFNCNTFEAVL